MSKAETHYNFQAGTRPVVVSDEKAPRYGVYAASFDPVHAGHILFALQAQKIAGLSRIYFVPERKPANGSEPEHYAHRSAMVAQALKPYRQFELFELPDARLTSRSLTRVTEALPRAELSLLTTAGDLLWYDGELPELYRKLHLIIAVVSHAQMAEVMAMLNNTGKLFSSITFVDIGTDHISSTAIRRSIRTGRPERGLLPSVLRYARRQWLYLPALRQR